MTDQSELCGAEKRDGTPCKSKAGECRWHGIEQPSGAAASRDESRRQGTPKAPSDRVAAVVAAAEADRWDAFILAVARGRSVHGAAQDNGFPESTCRTRVSANWEGCADLIKAIRSEMYDAVAGALVADGLDAVATLALGRKGDATATQVRAATATLDQMVKVRDVVTLAAELDELKRKLAGADEDASW
ncbi:hypothetical protein [Streptomyces sp. NBC_01314]|uniref:hypothetical protein n=1 Tax=Streptomyces sp. NBC_01314 TaxID=2903821 RepID=UPI003087AF9E|nr:hypothetical protein OG622_10870 [Streptomyces sp. NBC_01314]